MSEDPKPTTETHHQAESGVDDAKVETDFSVDLDDTSALEAEIEALKNALAQSQEQTLRAHADAQNARRRAQQDVERAHKFGVEKFVADMLPVADNLERAATAARDKSGDFEAVAEGVELTLKSLLDGLARHHVERVDPAPGEPFNPERHQAMTAVPSADTAPNSVLDVYQHGYMLHGRLVRPAMVVVSKAVEESPKPANDTP